MWNTVWKYVIYESYCALDIPFQLARLISKTTGYLMSGLNPARLPLIVSHTSGTFCGIVGRARVRLFLTFVFCHDKARKGVRKVRNERSEDRECSIELETHTWTASTTQVQIGNKTRREERRKECVRIICHFQFGQQNKVQLPGAKVEKTHTHTHS